MSGLCHVAMHVHKLCLNWCWCQGGLTSVYQQK